MNAEDLNAEHLNTKRLKAERLNAERAARLFLFGLLLGLPLALLVARGVLPRSAAGRTVDIRARMPEAGGWAPAGLTVPAGEPLHLRLTSDDVVHSFAVGQSDSPGLEINPGEVVETTLVFDRPGKYVFYCTRWCGPDHWRMRGTIEVVGEAKGENAAEPAEETPLYLALGIEIDAPHPAGAVPARRPSAERGEQLGKTIPPRYRSLDYLRGHSPADAWRDLREEGFSAELSEAQVWDLVALLWRQSRAQASSEEGRELYAQNCAACHGETGRGDGVMAGSLAGPTMSPSSVETNASPAGEEHENSRQHGLGHDLQPPTDFTDPETMLGASPALLQGKILRGGMGTGMPYWGPVLTEEQTWALVDYLWSFQFELNGE